MGEIPVGGVDTPWERWHPAGVVTVFIGVAFTPYLLAERSRSQEFGHPSVQDLRDVRRLNGTAGYRLATEAE